MTSNDVTLPSGLKCQPTTRTPTLALSLLCSVGNRGQTWEKYLGEMEKAMLLRSGWAWNATDDAINEPTYKAERPLAKPLLMEWMLEDTSADSGPLWRQKTTHPDQGYLVRKEGKKGSSLRNGASSWNGTSRGYIWFLLLRKLRLAFELSKRWPFISIAQSGIRYSPLQMPFWAGKHYRRY